MIEALQQLHLLRPHWLWALALLPLIAWLGHRRRLRGNAWRGAVDAHLLPHLLDAQPGRRGYLGAGLAMLAALLAIIALAGPSWQREPRPLWQARAPLVLALDLSGAANAADLPPSRLAQARARMEVLLRERADGQVGLLAYAQDAYVVAPLTDDGANVALFLDALDPSIMPGESWAPSRAATAIERGTRLLRQAGFDRGDILVLSDHADAQAIAAAATAAANGYRVSALGFGTDAGGPWRDINGSMQYSRLDAASLAAMASAGKGRYSPVVADGSDLAALGVLEARATDAVASNEKAGALWRDQGYWLLLPLLVLVAAGFRRHGAFAVLAVCLCLPWQPAMASGGDGDLWKRADQQAHKRLEQGAAAFRNKDFKAATEAWQGLPGADAHYNLGNALARQGRYEEAIAAYDEALRVRPGMEDASANRQAVIEAMKRKPPAGGGDNGKQQDDGEEGGDDQGGKQHSPGESGEPNEQGGEQPPRPGRQPAQPGEAGEAGNDPGPGQLPESTARRERELANQAWLRRVPDDPGGLLRERFLLEKARRQREGD